MKNFKFWWDSDKTPRAKIAPPIEMVGDFLESDLQDDPYRCDLILQHIRSVKKGKFRRWETVGNAYCLEVSSENTSLVCEFDEDGTPCPIDLEDLYSLVEEWKNFLENSSRN